MKELINELMNHGYSMDQAQRFIGKCWIVFRKLFENELAEGFNKALVEGYGHDNETVGD